MTIVQLKLDLWQQLEQAQAEPQATDWRQLCLAFDEAIAQTPVRHQLAIAGVAIEQMAEVLACRAKELWEGWGRSELDDPVLEEDLFSELVKQSLSLDLSDLVTVPELYGRSASVSEHGDGESQVAYRDKEAVLAELESVVGEEGEGAIELLEYDEDVSAWAEAIREWLKQHNTQVAALTKLEQDTGLSVVKLWLAGLLGGFEMTQERGFYDGAGVAIALR
jgi:hypothetical protein